MNIDNFNNILASTKTPVNGTIRSDLLPSQLSYGDTFGNYSARQSSRRIVINTPKESLRYRIDGNNNDREERRPFTNQNSMIVEEDHNVHNSMQDDSTDFKLKLQFNNPFRNFD